MRLISIVTIVFLIAASASAQVPGNPIKFYGGIGFSSPTDPVDFSDNFDKTYHAMLGIGFNIFPKIEVIPKIEYHTFSSDIEGLSGGKMKATMFGVDGKFTLSIPTVPFAPYAIGGVGLAAIKQDDFATAAGIVLNGLSLESQTKMYIDYGFGLQWKLMPTISAFGQLQWVSINTEGETTRTTYDGPSSTVSYNDVMKFWAFTVGIKVL